MNNKNETSEKQQNVLVSAYISPALSKKFEAYIKAYAQGNKSFALRLAIELLIATAEQQN